MKIYLVIVLLLLTTACNKVYEEDKAVKEARLELNRELFIECMTLAAQLPTQPNRVDDSDVSDCDSRAYWRSQ